jgi:nitrite reductase/ring-hydroxylating ferredoxin subunit
MAIITLGLDAVPDGGSTIIDADGGLKIAVFRVGERIAAIDNRCPHAGGSLGKGAFDGTIVHCPLHGFRVDVWRGVGNAGKPVRTFAVSMNSGSISITIPDSPR